MARIQNRVVRIRRMDQQGGTGTSVLQSAAGIGEEGTGKNESGELSTSEAMEYKLVSSRKLSGFSGDDNACDLFAPVCRPAAREHSGTA